MGEKVIKGIKTEDGSYRYYYDRSSSLGGKERKNLITGEKNNSYPKKKMPVINRKGGSKKAEKKMPKARDMAMGDKNISYVGDPFIVDGKVFDPAKEFPETYMRPEGAKTFNMGGDAHVSSCGCDSCMGESSARGAGIAIKGTGFKGVF